MPKKYKYRKTFTYEGRRYSCYGDSEKEALLRMFEKQKALQEGKVAVSGSMTVEEWTAIALKTYKPNVSPQTMRDMYSRINKHILVPIGFMPIKHVRAIDCQEIMNAQAGMSFSHIDKLSQELKFIFDTARKNKLIIDNPAEDIIKPKSVKKNRNSISETERAAFLEACSGTDRFLVFELMLYCGCRPKEAAKAKGDDIFLQEGTPVFHIRGTKTVNSDRLVPMPVSLYERLKDVPSESPLAPNDEGRFHTESSYTRRRKSLRRAMNIAMGCRVYRNQLMPPYPLRTSFVPYELRHTYCTDLARRGVDIRVAQRLMGHSTIQITADIYTHIQNEQIVADALKILGEAQ